MFQFGNFRVRKFAVINALNHGISGHDVNEIRNKCTEDFQHTDSRLDKMDFSRDGITKCHCRLINDPKSYII